MSVCNYALMSSANVNINISLICLFFNSSEQCQWYAIEGFDPRTWYGTDSCGLHSETCPRD